MGEAVWCVLHKRLIYEKLTSTVGDIISVNAMGQIIVVLNSLHVAKDLLEKRGAIYIDRPRIPVIEM